MKLTTKEKIAVMQGYEDGKTIEFKANGSHFAGDWVSNEWDTIKNPTWMWDNFTYRIAEEKKQDEQKQKKEKGIDLLWEDIIIGKTFFRTLTGENTVMVIGKSEDTLLFPHLVLAKIDDIKNIYVNFNNGVGKFLLVKKVIRKKDVKLGE